MILQKFRNQNIESKNVLLKMLANKIDKANKQEKEEIMECWGDIIKQYTI